MKKIILAGIGAAATTADKSKEILDDLVKRGELTVEQGKVLNEELKHNVEKGRQKGGDGCSRSPEGTEPGADCRSERAACKDGRREKRGSF